MKTTLALVLCILSSGCVYTKYTHGDKSLTRISVGGNQSVGKVDLNRGTMEGYVSEQAQVAGAVVEAAVKAAIRP